MKRSLIVEDYDVLADVESLLCTMEGYAVRVAHDIDEALCAFDEFRPDLVLPNDSDGNRFLDSIRGSRDRTTKVLVVSGRLDAETIAGLEAREGVQTRAKPFQLTDMTARVQAASLSPSRVRWLSPVSMCAICKCRSSGPPGGA